MFQISPALNDALEALLKKLPLEAVGNIWDAWRTKEHRQEVVVPTASETTPAAPATPVSTPPPAEPSK